MTVVVWDGKDLAVDSHASDGKAKGRATKVWRYESSLLTGSGHLASILEMVEWVVTGASPLKFPKCQQGPRQCVLIRLGPDGISRWESTPYPIQMSGEPFAYGAGAEFAYGALHMGASAAQAVDAAIRYSPYCFGEPVVYSIVEGV